MNTGSVGASAQVRWGVLGVARIATKKVIPAMQAGQFSTVRAIASRDPARARQAAGELGVPRAYGSYDALIDDPEIDAVYIPLPNHMHVDWTIRAAEAGKHVLCEKPIGLSAADVVQLIDVRNRTGVLIQEAFMVRTHPQWLGARDIARSGRIGDVRAINGYFSFFNDDPANIRNIKAYGGGGILDIGCYLVNTARMILGSEPRRVCALVEKDPSTGVDWMASMMLDFDRRHAVGTCSTQLAHAQRITIAGTARADRDRNSLQCPSRPSLPDLRRRLAFRRGTGSAHGGVRSLRPVHRSRVTCFREPFSTGLPPPIHWRTRSPTCR